MNQSTEQLLQKLQGKRVGVFVDDSNLYHAYQKYGWRNIEDFREEIGMGLINKTPEI